MSLESTWKRIEERNAQAQIVAQKLADAIIAGKLQGAFLASEFKFGGLTNSVTLKPDDSGFYSEEFHQIPALLNKHLGINKIHQFPETKVQYAQNYQTSGVVPKAEFECVKMALPLAKAIVAKSLGGYATFEKKWGEVGKEIHIGAAAAFSRAIKDGVAFTTCKTSPYASDESDYFISLGGIALRMEEFFYDAIKNLANIALGKPDAKITDEKFYLPNGDSDKQKIYELLLAIQAVENAKQQGLKR